jgi:DNA polymerase III delta prime subunit
LTLSGEFRERDRSIIMELVNLTKEVSQRSSIYKGQSVLLPRGKNPAKVDLSDPLEFFNPFKGNEVPIFNEETQRLIDYTIKGPIIHSDRCRKHKIPLKRGILLEGPYGTGKSLTARDVARTANEYNWTFLSVADSRSLHFAMRFAQMYQPCVVFCEDIDRVAEDRNDGANDLINEISGVMGNSDEIIIVLTTNFPDKIDKAMLRPGRLDGVVSLTAPEGDTVAKLIRHYAGDLLDPNDTLKKTVEHLSGNIPSTIREVVERCKTMMLMHGKEMVNGRRPDDRGEDHGTPPCLARPGVRRQGQDTSAGRSHRQCRQEERQAGPRRRGLKGSVRVTQRSPSGLQTAL